MSAIHTITLRNLELWQIIENSDRLNRSINTLVKGLSKFLLGVLVIVVLLPIILIFFIITALVSGLALEIGTYSFNKALKSIHDANERDLMMALLDIEDLARSINRLNDQHNSTAGKIYNQIFLGKSWEKYKDGINRLVKTIDERVYPNSRLQPSKDQLRRLAKAYEGIHIN